MKRIALLLALAITPAAAQTLDLAPTSVPFFREQIRAAQQPATRAETPREIELRKCFETGPRDDSRPKWQGQCIKEAAGK